MTPSATKWVTSRHGGKFTQIASFGKSRAVQLQEPWKNFTIMKAGEWTLPSGKLVVSIMTSAQEAVGSVNMMSKIRKEAQSKCHQTRDCPIGNSPRCIVERLGMSHQTTHFGLTAATTLLHFRLRSKRIAPSTDGRRWKKSTLGSYQGKAGSSQAQSLPVWAWKAGAKSHVYPSQGRGA